jgi:hypothetical protein
MRDGPLRTRLISHKPEESPMTTGTPTPEHHRHHVPDRSATLVWIDSREAFVVRWLAGEGKVERIESDVPVHHRSTGRARHDATHRQGAGAVVPQPSVEGPRLEHLARFVAKVAETLSDEDLVVLGPGTVREHLVNKVEEMDARHHHARRIVSRPARRLTIAQLIARLRVEIGETPPRKPITRRRRVIRRPTRVAVESQALTEELDEEI